jgi:hypothetical protein
MRLLLALSLLLGGVTLSACNSGQPAPGTGPSATQPSAPGATAPTPGKACGGA